MLAECFNRVVDCSIRILNLDKVKVTNDLGSTYHAKTTLDHTIGVHLHILAYIYAKQKHLGCKKGEANQKQQLSDYKSIHSYTCD